MYARFSPLATQRDGARPSPEAMPLLDDLEVDRAARTNASVLFTGPVHVRTLALRIHTQSGWRWGPFVAIDCTEPDAALHTKLIAPLESDVSRGGDAPAPTLLQPGTIFLHEVGRLSMATQARLRDLLEMSPRQTGRRTRRRIMASSSEPLLPRVLDGTFDDRLYYRLNVLHFVLPGTMAD